MATSADVVTEPLPDSDSPSERGSDRCRKTGSAPRLLELLDNEYTRNILKALCRGPQRGRDLIDTCEASRATIYRRLDRLEAAGLIATGAYVDPDGHHCETYRLRLDRLRVSVESGTVSVTVRSTTEDDGTHSDQ